MKQAIQELFSRTYDVNEYNCTHFVIEAWRILFGEDISEKFEGVAQAFNADKRIKKSSMQLFKQLDRPKQRCIVCFQKPYTAPHVGVFYCDKVLHITENGVQFLELHKILPHFERVSFYE